MTIRQTFSRPNALIALLCLAFGQTALAAPPGAQSCGSQPLALQILGSGGPEATDRAGPAYLLWMDGKARLLIDAGPGARLRLGEAGGRMEDLEAIFLTHLHADHANDLPALVKAAYFTPRSRRLDIVGPGGNAAMPGTRRWLATLFGPEGYRYLAGHLAHDHGEDFPLRGINVDPANPKVREVWRSGDLVVRAAAVPHGPIPALAYRVEGPGFVVAVSGDTSGDGPGQAALEQLAAGATVFIAHHAIPESAGPAARRLHMAPSRLGAIAGAARPAELVLSHRMTRTLGQENETGALIRKAYTGPLRFAEDLDCLPLGPSPRRP